MNYEEEADEIITGVWEETMGAADVIQWLRQHDARLLREEASGYTEGNGPYYWWEIRDNLERRAREIESEIGEKP